MATHQSALKRHRQSEKRRARNKGTLTRLHNLRKKVLGSKGKEEGLKNLKELVSAFHKAARKSVVPANTASRNISRLTRIVNKMA